MQASLPHGNRRGSVQQQNLKYVTGPGQRQGYDLYVGFGAAAESRVAARTNSEKDAARYCDGPFYLFQKRTRACSTSKEPPLLTGRSSATATRVVSASLCTAYNGGGNESSAAAVENQPAGRDVVTRWSLKRMGAPVP